MTGELKKEDLIEYRGVKELKPKYQMKIDRFFFIPEEVHILPESSSIMVQNNFSFAQKECGFFRLFCLVTN